VASRHYKSSNLAEFYRVNRIKFEQLYDSEKFILSMLEINPEKSVLDIGCACAGLGMILAKEFRVQRYLGIEINEACAQIAKTNVGNDKILVGDFLNLCSKDLKNKKFDLVFSLSCIDWNDDFDKSLMAAWNAVNNLGYLILNLRLTTFEGSKDAEKAYQYINFEGRKAGEIAPYVVVNSSEILEAFKELHPSEILVKGYAGRPPSTVISSYDEIIYITVALKKEIGKTNKLQIKKWIPTNLNIWEV
jgi:SAM-dependent methyltransferase